ncbi:ERF family protein [Pseudomonas sp. NPDC077649]|uniref:ERF family protein n=1 Tax=Pseudomonas sp. NPDC077649 TaxID=3364423 RepID=UPI0037C962C7
MEQNIELQAKLYAALAKAQGEFLPIEKNRDGQDGNRTFKYADLDELIKKTRPALAANGLAVLQILQKTERGHVLITKLVHTSGATETSEVELGSGYDKIKIYGATITFMRRYAYQAILCVSADDDLDDSDSDGVSLPKQSAERQPEPKPTTTGKPPYPDEKLQEMLPKWQALIASGQKSADRVIATVSSGNSLTEDQIAQIRALEEEEAQA